MNIRRIFFLATMLGASLLLIAQETEPTVEELYLQSSIKTRIIRVEATSPDMEMKLIALKDIAEMMDGGNVTDTPEIVEILAYLASESVTNITREEGRIMYDYPEIRREAVRLLGRLGTVEAVRTLGDVIFTDPEPMVISEAILAISNIEMEDVNFRNRALYAAIYRQTARNKDNNLAFTFLLALENIVNREKKIYDLGLIEELAKIADARQGFNISVREKAFELLKSLQNL